MTLRQALAVWWWRCIRGNTWRAVAWNYSLRYDVPLTTNQLFGMDVCQRARRRLPRYWPGRWN